jgi:hypothetical protein
MPFDRRGQLIGDGLHDRYRSLLGGGRGSSIRLGERRNGDDGAKRDGGGKSQSAQHG